MSDLDIQQEFETNGHSPKLWDYFYKPPSGAEEKNAFIALNDSVDSSASKLEDKWDDAKAAYEEQREVSLESFRENLKRLVEAANRLIAEVNKEAKSKKYIDLNQE